ncbi:helix-turn-helix domain-containing protein [Sunxiuqinia indica]|uniref:helix-turn-helix domain-containing protein n=1 Tax=Sunxiuqinia indica TaxID=2692584 RepID=UPI00135B89AF|nr:AraC family transcriptional regulator [Sunxiuqinia indica]
MKLHIRNMVSNRCKMIVKSELNKLGLHFILVDLGEVEIMEKLTTEELAQLNNSLQESGLAIIGDKKGILIERIKNIIIELVHYSEEQIKVNLSDHLSEKLNYDYTYLSNLFKEHQGITIEHFLLTHKVERVKELLVYDELNVSEIAYIMHYSSVAHLSNQFKKLTGLTPSQYKQLKIKRNPLENM